jgi:hypothetical protein
MWRFGFGGGGGSAIPATSLLSRPLPLSPPMQMRIDHLFIFTDDGGAVADQLVAFGLTEGSSRIHPGQGTTNRKLYFENFFLEILWVHDEAEINSESVAPTGLRQRANFRETRASRFGLCLVNDDTTDALFAHAFRYQPAYFPSGLVIDVVANSHQPDFPWTFRLPFKETPQNQAEPTTHKNGLGALTEAHFFYSTAAPNHYVDAFCAETQIRFSKASKPLLVLTFDNQRQGQQVAFDALQLVIKY